MINKNKKLNKNHGLYKKNITIEKIIELAKQNYNQPEIANFFNVNRITIIKRLQDEEINWDDISNYIGSSKHIEKHSLYKNISVEDIINAHENGLKKLKDVANYFNVSETTIVRKLNKDNLKWSQISGNDGKYKKGNKNWSAGKKYTKESRQKMRISRIKNIEEKNGQIHPNYNPNSCKFFDFLNYHLKWNGQHAENDGEYYIKPLGYWIDFYEPELNLVIEWDEKHHYYANGILKEKDIKRQKEIEEYLGCKIIRIKEENNMNFIEITNKIINKLI